MGARWLRSCPWLVTSWGHDQVMLGVDGGLHIVADHASSAPAGGHGPRIWIGQRDLLVGRVLNRPLHRPQGLHLSPQAGNLLPPPARLGLGAGALSAVGAIQRREVPRDAGVDLLQPLADLGHRVVLVAIVHRFELATVDRNNGTSEEFEPTAKLDEPSAAFPLSLRKSAIVLKSGASRPTNHISSILRCASRSSRRL